MATKTIQIPATLEWAKLFETNRDFKYDQETDGACSVDLIVDEDGVKLIESSGIRKVGKPTDCGNTRYKMKRPFHLANGPDWACGPPKVYQPNGQPWVLDELGLIGNGSTGVAFVDVYDSTMGVGCRLKAVQVINHIPHESNSNGLSDYVKDYTNGDQTSSVSQDNTQVDEIPF